MNTQQLSQQHISTFADGETPDSHVDMVLASLRSASGRETWDVYHQIGDVLRSDEMSIMLSDDFTTRFSARLDAEPAIIAPGISNRTQRKAADSTIALRVRRFAVPGMAAAAVAAVVVFASAPQLMVASKSGEAHLMLAAAGNADTALTGVKLVQPGLQNAVVLRDPRIDEYLLAHQRYSPSVFSTVQYARSATFATESGK